MLVSGRVNVEERTEKDKKNSEVVKIKLQILRLKQMEMKIYRIILQDSLQNNCLEEKQL